MALLFGRVELMGHKQLMKEHYYWADERPGNNNFHVHDLGKVPSSDYGNNVSFIIDWGGNNSTWAVLIRNFAIQYSTNNTMYPDQIQLGMELTGTSGESGNTGYFVQNRWANPNNNVLQYQTNSGQPYDNAPIESGWNEPPNNSNYGGSFYTSCPC